MYLFLVRALSVALVASWNCKWTVIQVTVRMYGLWGSLPNHLILLNAIVIAGVQINVLGPSEESEKISAACCHRDP